MVNAATSDADERHSKSTSCASSSTSFSSTDEGNEDDTADDDNDEDDVTDDDVCGRRRAVSAVVAGVVAVGEVMVASADLLVAASSPEPEVVVGRALPSVVASIEVTEVALAIERLSWKSVS